MHTALNTSTQLRGRPRNGVRAGSGSTFGRTAGFNLGGGLISTLARSRVTKTAKPWFDRNRRRHSCDRHAPLKVNPSRLTIGVFGREHKNLIIKKSASATRWPLPRQRQSHGTIRIYPPRDLRTCLAIAHRHAHDHHPSVADLESESRENP